MQGPTIPNALIELLTLDPDGSWVDLPATWWVDSEGVVHGKADHAATNTQIMNALAYIQQALSGTRASQQGNATPPAQTSSSKSNGAPGNVGTGSVVVTGTLGEMLSQELCTRKGCVSIVKLAGETGERVGRTAQLISEAAALFTQVKSLAVHRPYRLVKDSQAWQKKLSSLMVRRGSSAADREMFDRITASFISEIERLCGEAEHVLASERFQKELLEAAAMDLMWGPTGPMRNHVERIAGTAGAPSAFHDGIIRSAEQLDEFLEQLDQLRPQLATQFKGLKVGEHVHPNASVVDLISLRWQETAKAELCATRAEINAALTTWSTRRDLAVLDVAAAMGASHLPEGRFSRVHLTKAVSVPVEGFDHVPGELIATYNGPGSEVEDIVGASQLAFPACRNESTSSRLAVVPTVVAAALAGNDGSMYVELGVEHLSSELAAELMTAETLLRDGGVYETIRSAWLAATRL